jgi:type IV pilus assembly protein PilQ
MDRTAILADDAVEYTMTMPDATTVVISMPNASIRKEASDRIFPDLGGPISLIHAFQQPDVEVPEVRVVFTRAPNLIPVVSRRGSMLFVDFEDKGVAAAPPPAFPNAGVVQTIAESHPNPATLESLETSTPDGLAEEALLADAEVVVIDPSAAPMPTDPMPSEAFVNESMPIEVASDLPSFEAGAAAPPASLDSMGSVWDAPVAAANAPAAVEVPAAIEVLEEGGLIDGKEYRGRRVSLDFKDVEIADVLRLIAEVSDLNIIAGDEVTGNVTIRLVEVPWDQALDVILMTKGLGFLRVGNVLRIAPSEVLKAEEEVRLQERRNKEKLEDLEVKLLPVNYAAVKDIAGLVKRLLSARGTVNMDERTNTLIIKDISSVIDEASALIAAIDTQTPQVMIEAKIVEANLDFSRELGSVWGIGTQQFVDPFDPDTPRTDLGSEDLTFIDNNSLVFSNPITSVPNGLLTLGALILDQDFRIDAQIQAAESTGDGKVISSPRIVTLDNKEASIEQGVSIPFQTFEGGDAKLEFIDAVLSLKVTPHITADESIIMEIEITRNAPDDTVATPTGSPAIAKNVAKTETLVKDGQTLVLGGIYTITKSTRQSRIPYLHRIPVIGNMFKNNEITDARKELLVFVTPRIVRLPEMASN